MAKFLFVRHGQTNYDAVDERNFIGQGRDLAPLTDLGINQLIETSKDSRLKDSNIIISSPYTRALQSAAIISKEIDVEIRVEVGLHEWVPDIVEFQHKSSEECFALARDYAFHKGVHPPNEVKVWETTESMNKRMDFVLDKYKQYDKVIVVCHGMVIRTQKYQEDILNGEIIEYEKS
jgi:broad specificity phosphatase PhoE